MTKFYYSFCMTVKEDLQLDKTNKSVCVSSAGLDQPGHLPSLNRVLTTHMTAHSDERSRCTHE